MSSGGDWLFLIANLIKFYEGGIAYSDAKLMTFSELFSFNQMAKRINREIEDALGKK